VTITTLGRESQSLLGSDIDARIGLPPELGTGIGITKAREQLALQVAIRHSVAESDELIVTLVDYRTIQAGDTLRECAKDIEHLVTIWDLLRCLNQRGELIPVDMVANYIKSEILNCD
jgi:hypothetical protein